MVAGDEGAVVVEVDARFGTGADEAGAHVQVAVEGVVETLHRVGGAEEETEAAAQALDPGRDGGAAEELSQTVTHFLGGGVNVVVEAGLADLGHCGEGGVDGERVAGEGAALSDCAVGANEVHDIGLAGDDDDGAAVGDRFAEDADVGRDAIAPLSAVWAGPEGGERVWYASRGGNV